MEKDGLAAEHSGSAQGASQSDTKEFCLHLPAWAWEEMAALPSHLPSLEERMAAVIRFARLNTKHASGGPFAAGVFERDSGKVIVLAVNRVMPLTCSCAHAEVMAISLPSNAWGVLIWELQASQRTNWWSTGCPAPCVLVRYSGPGCVPWWWPGMILTWSASPALTRGRYPSIGRRNSAAGGLPLLPMCFAKNPCRPSAPLPQEERLSTTPARARVGPQR